MSRRLMRNHLKEIYKNKRREDALVGRRINELTKVWLAADREYSVEGDKVSVKTTPEAEDALAELQEIKQERRFREDFPTFSTFKTFVKKNKILIKELED